MSVIALAGMIGSGKSSLTKKIAEHLNSDPFYESVKDNPVLDLFYKDPQKYAFLLQIYFLNTRFKSIKKALNNKNNVLDRTIYEDSLFFHVNAELGRATKTEVKVYDELLNNMLEEIDGLPKKAPDLMVYIHVDYDTMLKRIKKRGRPFEQPENDSTLEVYYKTILGHYDDWYNNYNASDKILIDGTTLDFVEHEKDLKDVLAMIDSSLALQKDLTI